MTCEPVEIMLLEQESGDLSPDAQATLADHVGGCADCGRFAEGLAGVSAAKLRRELAPPEPGEAFFVRTRNEIWHALESAKEAQRVPASAAPVGFWARLGWALRRLGEVLFVQRHGLATTAVAAAAVAVLTVALWPRQMRPPSLFLPSEISAPTSNSADAASEEASEGDVLADVGSLSKEEMQMLSTRLTIDTSADVSSVEVEDDPEGVEGQLESLSPEELKAFDVQIAQATREAKGA